MYYKFILSLFSLTLLFSQTAMADVFLAKKIKIIGLERISRDTVLNYLPVKRGHVVDSQETAEMLRALYATGFFSDVRVGKKANALIISVVENPVIGSLRFSGNKEINDKKLREVLTASGFTEGRVFSDAVLANIKQSLINEYKNQSYEDVIVTVDTQIETRNRVAVSIKVSEGKVTKIKKIVIIGNQHFSTSKLLKEMKLSPSGIFSYFTSDDNYSEMKLNEDLESLRNFYLDKGYLQFRINSHQVDFRELNKKSNKHLAVITIRITEGPVYAIKGYAVDIDDSVAEFRAMKLSLLRLVQLKRGALFSRSAVMQTNTAFTHYLAAHGYAFPDLDVEPEVDESTHQVFIHFKVNPSHLYYVRRINFIGHNKTSDFVLRREMRQLEGGLYSMPRIEESKRRLSNLGYLENVQVTPSPVPGHTDRVDLNFQVKEVSATTASVQAGYSDTEGLLYGANFNQLNFLGVGKSLAFAFERSEYARTFSIGYNNPYYTDDGMSRGFKIYSQKVMPGRVDLSSYARDGYGADVQYSTPISDYSRLDFGYGYEYTRITVGYNPANEIASYLGKHGNRFNQYKINGGWSRSTYNSSIFTTQGVKQQLGVEVGLPFDHRSLDYYIINYNIGAYHPLVKRWTVGLRGDLGYAGGYGRSGSDLPFFKNFYAGGIDSVHGFEASSLGPRDSHGGPLGGNILSTASIGLILPDSEHVRTTLFADAGNVYKNNFDFGALRYSVGAAVQWRTALAPLVFSLSKPLKTRPGDRLRSFQFTVGTSL